MKTKKVKDPNAVKRGKTSRRKGLTFEREIATQLAHIFPKAKRHLEFQSDEAELKIDLVNTGPFRIQCKNKIKYENPKTLLETKGGEGLIRCLVTKAKGSKTLAVIEFDDLIKLIEIMYGLRKQEVTEAEIKESRPMSLAKTLPPFNTIDANDLLL